MEVTQANTRSQWLTRVHRVIVLPVVNLCLAVAMLGSVTSIASQEALSEGEAKALLLFNFAKYTTWPAKAFRSSHSPLIIGVIGKNKFGDSLKKFEGKRIKGRSIQVEHYEDPKDYVNSHILFCNVENPRNLAKLFKDLNLDSHHVLTVGDFKDFAKAGGVIGLTFEGNRLALEYNSRAARRAGIYLSENLVNLAKPVR